MNSVFRWRFRSRRLRLCVRRSATGRRPKINSKLLSPPQRPLCIVGRLLCCGEAGEKEKESARGTMGRGKREERLPPFPSSHRPPRAFYFCRLLIFWYFGDTQREPLRRRESKLYKHRSNTRWAFARKHDIFTCENNMLSSHVKISRLLRLLITYSRVFYWKIYHS